MPRFLYAVLACGLVACGSYGPQEPTNAKTAAAATQQVQVVDVSASHFAIFGADPSIQDGAIALRGADGSSLGVALSERDFCVAAAAGSVRVKGRTYLATDTVGQTGAAAIETANQANCEAPALNDTRWTRSSGAYGVGSTGRARVPFRSLACDFGNSPGSTPWLNGGYPAPGQEVFIKDAIGTETPDDRRHDGFFRCVDERPDIVGNQVAVFVGDAASAADAQDNTPFRFAQRLSGRTVQALLLP